MEFVTLSLSLSPGWLTGQLRPAGESALGLDVFLCNAIALDLSHRGDK